MVSGGILKANFFELYLTSLNFLYSFPFSDINLGFFIYYIQNSCCSFLGCTNRRSSCNGRPTSHCSYEKNLNCSKHTFSIIIWIVQDKLCSDIENKSNEPKSHELGKSKQHSIYVGHSPSSYIGLLQE